MMLIPLVCSNCADKKKVANKTSFDAAVAQAKEDFSAGNVAAIADLFVVTTEEHKEANSKFAESIAKSNPSLTFTAITSKVSGNMGVVVVTFNDQTTQYAFYAEWQVPQWKFHFNSITWVDSQQLEQAKLSKKNLNDAMILQPWVASDSQAGASGIGARDRLAWYLPFVPNDLNIEKFYETPCPAMDYEYMWKIKIEDTAEFKKFSQQLTAKLSNSAGKNDLSEVPKFDAHPRWWRAIDFEQGKLHRHFVTVVGSDGGERGYVFALIRREEGFIYIQAF